MVADFAIYLAQHKNVKAFYTTPIKALSNQKYHDLVERYGADQVGLLTGDTSINSEANIVVMTTEVLRNMIYERSTTLDTLRYVILDEIHYLGDRFRGQVWEEVIIHLPKRIKIVGLSATVSNIEDFGAWIESVRGATKLIVSERRPVPLDQSVILQQSAKKEPEIFDLYQHTPEDSEKRKADDAPRVNPELLARIREFNHAAEKANPEHNSRKAGGRGRRGEHGRRDRHGGGVARRFTPSRWAVVDELDYLDLLPGIYFIFSRAGCDAAVEQCLRADLELTTEEEARKIRRIADESVAGVMSAEDLKTLHYSSFRFGLERGFAAHHAGMVSLFREIVEKVFEAGLIRVVFATETLALGINMPARTVVIEKLEKFDGADHVSLTPGEYTQLTGRAGRRGIDVIGHAVVVDHATFNPTALAALSSRRVYPLHSQFSPTFNMAVNLLNVHGYSEARSSLDKSFAQWEANESSTDLETSIAKAKQKLESYEKAFACEYGDFKELLLLRSKLTDLERNEKRHLKHTQFRSEKERSKAFNKLDKEIESTRAKERAHPCRQCPDLNEHMKYANRWIKEHKELERLQKRYDTRTGIVARRFDLICSVLERLEYVKPKSTGFELTWRGQLLRHLYTEKDLLFAECLIQHTLDDVNAQELAALVSGLVYESRRSNANEPHHFPGGRNGTIAKISYEMDDIWDDLSYTVEQAGLDPLDQLDFGLAEKIFAWSADQPLSQVLDGTDLTAGDFVRTCKRLCDVLGQLQTASAYLPHAEHLQKMAGQAYELINRGVVAYSGSGLETENETGAQSEPEQNNTERNSGRE